MHASTMTKAQLDRLRRDAEAFFDKHQGDDVAIADARRHFEALGYTLTRPIEDTLQVHGFVEPQGKYPWPYPVADNAWRVDGEMLRAPLR